MKDRLIYLLALLSLHLLCWEGVCQTNRFHLGEKDFVELTSMGLERGDSLSRHMIFGDYKDRFCEIPNFKDDDLILNASRRWVVKYKDVHPDVILPYVLAGGDLSFLNQLINESSSEELRWYGNLINIYAGTGVNFSRSDPPVQTGQVFSTLEARIVDENQVELTVKISNQSSAFRKMFISRGLWAETIITRTDGFPVIKMSPTMTGLYCPETQNFAGLKELTQGFFSPFSMFSLFPGLSLEKKERVRLRYSSGSENLYKYSPAAELFCNVQDKRHNPLSFLGYFISARNDEEFEVDVRYVYDWSVMNPFVTRVTPQGKIVPGQSKYETDTWRTVSNPIRLHFKISDGKASVSLVETAKCAEDSSPIN